MENEENKTFDARRTDQLIDHKKYKPLFYENTEPDSNLVSDLAQFLLNKSTNSNFSKKKWKKRNNFILTYKNSSDNSEKHLSLSFKELSQFLSKERSIDNLRDKFPLISIDWLDKSIFFAPLFYLPENNSDKSARFSVDTSMLGPNFPLNPCIDREGVAYSSMQLQIQQSILFLREYLVENSKDMFNSSNQWVINLMNYFNNLVSLVDITLIQLYYKANFDSAKMGWSFNLTKLGQTFNRSLEDKLKWIGEITNKPLDNARDEIFAFKKLKSIRNHFNHFDPPIMAYTIDDVANWMNFTIDIAKLIWKIRDKIGSNISNLIVRMLLCKKVSFQPIDPGKIRHPQYSDVGYNSCIWPKEKYLVINTPSILDTFKKMIGSIFSKK